MSLFDASQPLITLVLEEHGRTHSQRYGLDILPSRIVPKPGTTFDEVVIALLQTSVQHVPEPSRPTRQTAVWSDQSGSLWNWQKWCRVDSGFSHPIAHLYPGAVSVWKILPDIPDYQGTHTVVLTDTDLCIGEAKVPLSLLSHLASTHYSAEADTRIFTVLDDQYMVHHTGCCMALGAIQGLIDKGNFVRAFPSVAAVLGRAALMRGGPYDGYVLEDKALQAALNTARHITEAVFQSWAVRANTIVHPTAWIGTDAWAGHIADVRDTPAFAAGRAGVLALPADITRPQNFIGPEAPSGMSAHERMALLAERRAVDAAIMAHMPELRAYR